MAPSVDATTTGSRSCPSCTSGDVRGRRTLGTPVPAVSPTTRIALSASTCSSSRSATDTCRRPYVVESQPLPRQPHTTWARALLRAVNPFVVERCVPVSPSSAVRSSQLPGRTEGVDAALRTSSPSSLSRCRSVVRRRRAPLRAPSPSSAACPSHPCAKVALESAIRPWGVVAGWTRHATRAHARH